MEMNEYFAVNGEEVIKEKIAELKTIQAKLDEALKGGDNERL